MTERSTVLGMTQRTVSDGPSYLKIEEAADLLRLSRRTVERYIADGRLIALRTPTGQPRLRRGDVEALLSEGAAS